MSTITPPYRHHPELQGLITDPKGSYFRTFSVETALEASPERQALLAWVYSDEEREGLRRAFFGAGWTGDLWVFAYGSLMWDPALDFAEVRRAFVPGHARRFILMDDKGGRGTGDAPGLMAALDNGAGCDGLAFRIPADAVEIETEILWRREMIGPGYTPAFVSALIGGEPTPVLTFLADPGAEAICPDLTRDDQIRMIATGAGILGTSHAYLSNIVSHFVALGIVDQDCTDLLRDVEDYLARE